MQKKIYLYIINWPHPISKLIYHKYHHDTKTDPDPEEPRP
jgi:hypothetical protein